MNNKTYFVLFAIQSLLLLFRLTFYPKIYNQFSLR